MPTYFQIPEPSKAQLWHVDGKDVYVVYYAPGTKVPMAWHVEDITQLQAIIGPDQQFKPDRNITKDQFFKAGGLMFGESKELANLTEHPFRDAQKQFEKEVEVQPWLKDPEIRAVFMGAMLEGRQPTQGELKTTNWWQTHNDAQRAWIGMHASDPATAAQTADSNRRRVRDALSQAGVANPPGWLVGAIANPYTRGDMTDAQLADAVRSISDPRSRIRLPGPVAEALGDRDMSAIDRTQAGEDRVRDLVRTYLGPRYGQWDQAKVERWAGRLRNDPDAEQQLVSTLQGQLRKLYQTDEKTPWDPTTTWDDLASPWISLAQSTWGQQIDPGDELVDKLIRLNDQELAGQHLRKVGLNRNIPTVVNDTMSAMSRSFDLDVRRMI